MVSLSHPESRYQLLPEPRGELCFTASLDCALEGLSRWSVSSFCYLEMFRSYSFDNSFRLVPLFSFSFLWFSIFSLYFSYIAWLYSRREWPARYPLAVRLLARLYYSESAPEMRFVSSTSETWLVYLPMKCRFSGEKDVGQWIAKLTTCWSSWLFELKVKFNDTFHISVYIIK